MNTFMLVHQSWKNNVEKNHRDLNQNYLVGAASSKTVIVIEQKPVIKQIFFKTNLYSQC